MRNVLVPTMLLAGIVLSGQKASAATSWVSPNALGPAPGISCNTAGYAAIQAAINAANAGDTVNVCPGSYLENTHGIGCPRTGQDGAVVGSVGRNAVGRAKG